MHDWSHVFVGRDAELDALKKGYAKAAAGEATVMAVVAESGFGKTRLVQEFYNWLATHHDASGEEGYWPDRLLKREDNLLVNPLRESFGSANGKMPFLWWALRVADPEARNESVTGALWGGLDDLKPHFAAYERAVRKEVLSKKSQGSLVGGVVDLSLDALGNVFSFGLLATGKMVLEKGVEFYDIRREIAANDLLDVSPKAAGERARDELQTTLLSDLYRVAKSPPKGFRPIPLVVVVDDAQWLAGDAGTSAFIASLIKRGRAEQWPLLVVLTSWEREWRESHRNGRVPAALLDKHRGEEPLHLSRTPGLEEIVQAALPGLTDFQVRGLVGQVDGNPRYLEEILKHLLRNKKHFLDRDLSSPLTEKGFAAVQAMAFPDFVEERFAEAPEHVRRALALASQHGVSFSPRMVKLMAEHLSFADAPAGLMEGEDPHGFAKVEEEKGQGEFRMRAYRNAAADDLANHADEDEAQEALTKAYSAITADVETASDRELLLVLESSSTDACLNVAVELIRRAKARNNPRAASAVAAKAWPTLIEELEETDPHAILTLVSAAWQWGGPSEIFRRPLESVINKVTDAEGKPEQLQLALALMFLGRLAQEVGDPAKARPRFEQLLQVCRAIAQQDPSQFADQLLADGLSAMASYVQRMDGAIVARPYVDELLALCRKIAAQENTSDTRLLLAGALDTLGRNLLHLEGPASARPAYEEALEIWRALARDEPDLRKDLGAAIINLGGIVGDLEGAAAAKRYHEEGADILRTLAEETRSRPMILLAAASIRQLAQTVHSTDGPAPALALYRECIKLQTEHVGKQSTYEDALMLAVSYHGLGSVLRETEGPEVAATAYSYALTILQSLSETQASLRTKRAHAQVLTDFVPVLASLGRDSDAKLLCEAAVEVYRELAAAHGSARAQYDLAAALTQLGELCLELKTPAAGRAAYEEAAGILRQLLENESNLDVAELLAHAVSRCAEIR